MQTSSTQFLYGKTVARTIASNVFDALQKIPDPVVVYDVVHENDTVGMQYVRVKGKAAGRVGIDFQTVSISRTDTTESVCQLVAEISGRKECMGCIVQLPLPEYLDQEKILSHIARDVDVDCLHPESVHDFYEGRNMFIYPTARAICALLDDIPGIPETAQYVIVGEGMLVGRPVAHLLRLRGYTVQTVNRTTPDGDHIIKNADVVISATGRPGRIVGAGIKSGAVVIDAGTSESRGSVVGDVEYDSVDGVASWIVPVPGGVGPVTVAMLFDNVVRAVHEKQGMPKDE